MPGAIPLTEAERRRIVSEHSSQQGGPRKRREIRSGAGLGPPGRRPVRRGKKRMAHGKKGKQTEITVPSAKKRLIRIEDQIQLQELAGRMSLKAVEVLMKLMQMGVSGVHINSTLDADTAALLAEEFNYEVENVARTEEEIVGDARGEYEDDEASRSSRPPIVTVMGHVDHGKTSLLDRIRKADVASGEAGGITQHIGAYRVETDKGTVVFLDTPGHEAFTAMRARGANSTDIVILVVAADDGVMPQTEEAVNHSKAAGVPIVVAVNKIDRPDANADKVKNELAALGLTPEEWGGDTMYVECSAITGQGVDDLVSSVALQAELLELTANPEIPAAGVVLEAYLDRGRGPVANVLVRDGSLRAGDFIVAGGAWGRVRAMTDDRGKQIKVAPPATPVEVLGLSDLPAAGDSVYQVTDAKKAQSVAEGRRGAAGQGVTAPTVARGLDQLQQLIQQGEQHELELVVKADVQGSVEALQKSLVDLSTEKVKVRVIHTGVGAITENDVMLASASQAIVLGFNVRPQGKAGRTAKKEGTEIRTYSVIYEAIDDVKAAMAGLLAPKLVEKELGKAEIRQTFSIPKAGTIAGSFVTEGKVTRSGKARLVRDGVVVWEGQLASLRRFKEDVREVASGYECGIGLAGYNDMKERDVIELYEIEEVEATLDDE
ncbi:MAG: translation initiation factor IF-2 [Deltaproteobacteria bacterium]|nr:translation initiation factor IF-2 [Deltaproteobacteria bacterium]